NPRNTPVCHINLGPGHDLVGALTAALSGREKPNNVAVTSNDIIALFPDAWMADSESRFLYTGYHDVPWEEPTLINELLKPKVRDRLWITRQVRKLRGYRQNLPLTFPESLPAWSSPWQLNRRRL